VAKPQKKERTWHGGDVVELIWKGGRARLGQLFKVLRGNADAWNISQIIANAITSERTMGKTVGKKKVQEMNRAAKQYPRSEDEDKSEIA